MAKRRRRNQSQKEPIGRTKSEILLFIADKPNVSLTDIRSYLRTEMNIRNPKVVRSHVSGLLQLNLIQRVKTEKGFRDKHFIDESFSSFRSAFNYLRENYEPKYLLKTNYFQKLKLSDDFFLLGIVNIIKILFVDSVDILSDDVRFEKLMQEAKKEGDSKEYIEKMTQHKEKYSKKMLIEYLPLLKDKSPEELISYAEEGFGKNIKIYLGDLLKQFILEDQKEEIINIISTSPSAMDYFLNMRTENKMMFFSVLLGFFVRTLFIDPSKVDILKSFNSLTDKSETTQVLGAINELVSTKNIVNQNPILTTLKAHFIQDAVSGKIIENEYALKVLTDILIPKVKS